MTSPKATLHMLYIQCEKQPKYETKEIFASQENKHGDGNGNSDSNSEMVMMMMMVSAPFLVKPQKIGYSCTLFLPDLPPVISDVFSRKKEAEQDAAHKALKQMGKSMDDISAPEVLSMEEKIVALAERIEVLFSEKVVMSCQSLKEHFRAAMRRKDTRVGALPVAAIAALDNKIISLCKSLHSYSESNPMFNVAMVWEAAKRCSLVTRERGFFIKRIEPFSSQFQEEFLASEEEEEMCPKFQAVYIPALEDAMVESIEIELDPRDYYLDALSNRLGCQDGSVLMISRAITRAPHGTRLYYIIPERLLEVKRSDDSNNDGYVIREILERKKCPINRNSRASDILGFSIYGDSILANVGSSWKLEGKLSFGDVSLSCYYRLILGRSPEGNYRLSRDAPLVAKMPCSFLSKCQWRGKLPRSLLTDFCQQHRMPDPAFTFTSITASNVVTAMSTCDNQKESTQCVSYKCMVKIIYQRKDYEFESERLYRNHNDASQSAALQALLFLSDIGKKYLNCPNPVNEEFQQREEIAIPKLDISESKASEDGIDKVCTEPNKTIAAGTMVSISCIVWLIGHHEDVNVESHEEFEFQLGIGGTLPEIENCVLGMQVGGYEQVSLPIPCLEALLATCEDAMSTVRNLDIGSLSSLRYDIKLLRTIEPPEERMESALFSPPLSKQRNEFAIQKIKEVRAKSLVDLGCGSGSLLDAVVDTATDLEHIAGVDISQKSLFRATKSLCGKLALTEAHSSSKLKELVLYEGSLADADRRLCDFDVATCIEVVEHMDPEPLLQAGEIILGTYAPKMLILSTPNIEYNVILQKVTTDHRTNSGECENRVPASMNMDNVALMDGSELKTHVVVDATISDINAFDDGPSMSGVIKLRNDDHRFEWTRAEFKEWANTLALKFGYAVEYDGVGGSVEDPGFASQIAIFTRKNHYRAEDNTYKTDCKRITCENGQLDTRVSPVYTVVWKYDKGRLPGEII